MPEVERHQPGAFCWAELATTEQSAAKSFYTELFGWTFEDRPMGPGEVYTMLKLRGLEVAALSAMRREEKEGGVPPHWTSYIAVESADRSARTARDLGGTLLGGPFDVMDVGRMAVVRDPRGAAFCLWEPRRHAGARLVREPGAQTWHELWTTDPAGVEPFYMGLFGWTAKKAEGPQPYTEFQLEGEEHAGMMQIREEWGEVPPQWAVYFQVDDCDETVQKAVSLGATILVSPKDIPGVGRFSVLADPQGADFAVIRLP
jgi:predicted enzyme related to lactoylglutathione lyase